VRSFEFVEESLDREIPDADVEEWERLLSDPRTSLGQIAPLLEGGEGGR
jgi:hypothetical protein